MDEKLSSPRENNPTSSSPLSIVSPIKPLEPPHSLFTRFLRCLKTFNERFLLIPKLIYFTLNLAVYSTHTYTAIYFFDTWGLAIWQFGAVSSISAVQFLGAIFWGHLADRTGRTKTILVATAFGYAVVFAALNMRVFTDENQMVWRIIHAGTLYGLSYFFVSALFPLVDSQVFVILSKDPKFTKEIFGRQRLWGTFGHALVTLVAAKTIELYGYIGMFTTMGVSSTLFVLTIIFGLPNNLDKHESADLGNNVVNEKGVSRTPAKKKVSEPYSPKSHTSHLSSIPEAIQSTIPPKHPVLRLLGDGHFLFFLTVILSAGFIRSIMSYFLPFYMQRDLHQSPVMVALTVAVRMFSEVGIFFFGREMLRGIGVYWMLIISQLAGIIRVFAYAFLPVDNRWFILAFLIELLKGLSTACLVMAAVRLAHDLAPHGCGNSAQALFSGIYSGLSSAIGGAVGGFIIYIYPGESIAGMFLISGIVASIALVLAILKYALVDRVIFAGCRR